MMHCTVVVNWEGPLPAQQAGGEPGSKALPARKEAQSERGRPHLVRTFDWPSISAHVLRDATLDFYLICMALARRSATSVIPATCEPARFGHLLCLWSRVGVLLVYPVAVGSRVGPAPPH